MFFWHINRGICMDILFTFRFYRWVYPFINHLVYEIGSESANNRCLMKTPLTFTGNLSLNGVRSVHIFQVGEHSDPSQVCSILVLSLN